jgi:hypothetical protein
LNRGKTVGAEGAAPRRRSAGAGDQPGRPIISVRVPAKLLDRMRELAADEGIEFADWLRAALLNETRRQERRQQADWRQALLLDELRQQERRQEQRRR